MIVITTVVLRVVVIIINNDSKNNNNSNTYKLSQEAMIPIMLSKASTRQCSSYTEHLVTLTFPCSSPNLYLYRTPKYAIKCTYALYCKPRATMCIYILVKFFCCCKNPDIIFFTNIESGHMGICTSSNCLTFTFFTFQGPTIFTWETRNLAYSTPVL